MGLVTGKNDLLRGVHGVEKVGRSGGCARVSTSEQNMFELKNQHFWWECKLGQALWRRVWRFLKKLNVELPYDPAIPCLGIYLGKTIIQKDIGSPLFTAAPFTTAKTWKQPKCPSTEVWLKKMWYINTMEYYSAIIMK